MYTREKIVDLIQTLLTEKDRVSISIKGLAHRIERLEEEIDRLLHAIVRDDVEIGSDSLIDKKESR